MITRTSFGRYPTKKLGEVVEFLDSMRRPITESDRRPGPYPYYGANGQQGSIDEFIFDEPLVLLAEDGGHFDTPERGIAYRVSGKSWVNNHAHVLRANGTMDQGFLCRVLENYDVSPWVTGTTRGKLTQAGAAQIVVPVPPLPEQRRIADILDSADALRIKRRAAIATLGPLTHAVFIEMFGDPIRNEHGWNVRTLGALSNKITDGTHKTPTYMNTGVPFMSAKDIRDGQIAWNTGKYIARSEHLDLIRRCNPVRGDVLLAKSGSLGSVAIIDRDSEFSLFESLCLIKYRRELIDGTYLIWMLRNRSMLTKLLRSNKGIAVKHLHLVDIKDLKVPVPPVNLQKGFSARATAIDDNRAVQFASRETSDSLFYSLRQTAFKGLN